MVSTYTYAGNPNVETLREFVNEFRLSCRAGYHQNIVNSVGAIIKQSMFLIHIYIYIYIYSDKLYDFTYVHTRA